MATKETYWFEYLASEGWLQHVEGINILLPWKLIYTVLLILLSFTLSIPIGGRLEPHDLSLTHRGLLASSTDHVPGRSYAPAFPLGVFIMLAFHEYLRSRFGEKRLVDPSSILTNLCFGASTALFISAVFYFAWDRLGPRSYST